mmetsp:Transcript_47721/g.57781  ORF Transcript_47721/g.57781 Transcript_47721/m.57781 type:complete len:141 (+) Transcript_47721:411-833(+)
MSEAQGFGFFGVIKEIGVDDEGLMDFSKNHFSSFDLYLDEQLSFYKALGERKMGFSTLLSLMMSPLSAWRAMKDIGERQKRKGIENNFKGEGALKGGVIVFDAEGRPRYAYLEETGDELPKEDILAAISDVRGKKSVSEL